MGPARADFLAVYNFTGRDGLTGNPVTGTFTYDTASRPVPPLVVEVLYPDVGGSLSITDGGHTYTSTSISGSLQANSLELLSNPAGSAGAVTIVLEWSGPGASSLSSLPGQLDPSRLVPGFSGFAITGGVTQPNIAGGTITGLTSAQVASLPEPGGLSLAAVGVVSLAAALRRRRRARAEA
jgi:hypothetical protein